MIQTINTKQGADKSIVITMPTAIDSYSNILIWIVDQNKDSLATPLKFSWKAQTGHTTGYITKTATDKVTFTLAALYTKALQEGVYYIDLKYIMTGSGAVKGSPTILLLNVEKSALKDV
jgi:hypothetical protein